MDAARARRGAGGSLGVDAANDLSGEWRGVFNYPIGSPPVHFTAALEDRAGLLSGKIVERASVGVRAGRTVAARVDGRREGSAVGFAKLYEPDDVYDSVSYRGELSPDGDEIVGRWTIPGEWSGNFIMIRARGVAAEAEAKATETAR